VTRRFLRPLLAAVSVAAAAPALAAQARAISVEGLARSSDAVVRGRVVASHARQREDGRIFTTYEIRTAGVLRGRAPSTVRVRVPGGVVGRAGQRVDAAPALTAGEDLVLFLRRAGEDGYVVAELAQGKFTVDGAQARPDLSRFTFVSTSVPPGERRAEEMPVAELERRVRSTR
jgi:hypothetical protein